MTREEADVVLYLVDELRKRGAIAVDINGVVVSLGRVLPGLPPGEGRPLPKAPRTDDEKLFGVLFKGQAKPGVE